MEWPDRLGRRAPPGRLELTLSATGPDSREALLAGNRVKQAIEAEYRGALGEAGFAALMQAFEILDGETD